MHVPIRAGTDIAFLGGLIRHVLETESYFKEYVLALHERRRRSSTRTSRTPRTSAASSPASTPRPGTYDRAHVDVRGRRGRRRRRPARARDAGVRARTPAPGMLDGDGRSATRRCSTRAASSRSSGATTRATRPRWSSEICGISRGAVPRGRRHADRATPAASAPRRSATPSAGRSTPPACR